jgi:SRSO17 transposase
VEETLGEADGGLFIGGSVVPKQGTHSAGTAQHWCGAKRKKDNCQAWVFLSYRGRLPLHCAAPPSHVVS